MTNILSIAKGERLHRDPAYLAIKRAWPDRAMLACSGGIDSSALLLLAAHALSRRDIHRFVVVHVDHRTRPEARAEGEYVARLCRELRLPIVRTVVDAEDLTSSGAAPEDVLRRARYASLSAVGRLLGLNVVVTAHTLDDQIETILMRLLSGTSPLGATGMRLRQRLEIGGGAVEVVRPLLDVSRQHLAGILDEHGVDACDDPTNRDVSYRRNAVRHRIIPPLREHYPGFEQGLARSVALAARDAEYADTVAADLYAGIVTQEPESLVIARRELLDVHPAIASRIIRRAARSFMASDGRELGFERVEQVRLAAAGRTGALIELPEGVVARVERATIRLQRRDDGIDADRA